MGHKSNIEWTEATWNPWHGCHKVSQGCKNCYMFRDKARYGQDPNVVVRSADKTFYAPLTWSEPRTIFTCSWSDFFIEEADAWRDEAFAIMALTPQHTYQVLTKRPERMLEYFDDIYTPGRIGSLAIKLRKERNIKFPNAEFQTEPLGYGDPGREWFPLKNVWLGVSVEDQKTADERIPLLLQTPAAVRWLSMEPLLSDVVFDAFTLYDDERGERLIDWVVAGGESGPEARPLHPEWARSIRDQCTSVHVPFFFKQWGEWWPISQTPRGWIDEHPRFAKRSTVLQLDGADQGLYFPTGAMTCFKVGKHVSGRDLDGRTWDEMPEVASA